VSYEPRTRRPVNQRCCCLNHRLPFRCSAPTNIRAVSTPSTRLSRASKRCVMYTERRVNQPWVGSSIAPRYGQHATRAKHSGTRLPPTTFESVRRLIRAAAVHNVNAAHVAFGRRAKSRVQRYHRAATSRRRCIPSFNHATQPPNRVAGVWSAARRVDLPRARVRSACVQPFASAPTVCSATVDCRQVVAARRSAQCV